MTLVIVGGAESDAPRLSWPVDCTFGVDFWIRQYLDLDPAPRRRDYACGAVTTDKHSGTDIGLRSEAQIADRVAVLAAAPGTVAG
ncbi:MAG: M23 family peptidase, partial [Pseudomonadota bacterium]|nr:M23 family peptidase [Pseudomonadota bacterium]